MHKGFAATAAIFGGLAVALGAFGAHGLKKMAGAEHADVITSFQTGVQYQMYHALALLIVAFVFDKLSAAWLRRAAVCFITGTILFSGSLYALTFLKLNNLSATWVGPITPFGGLFFIAGWLSLLAIALKHKN